MVSADLDYFIEKGNGKKIWFSENGWPSVTSPGVQPNSPNATANVENEAVSPSSPPHLATISSYLCTATGVLQTSGFKV